MSDRYIEIKQEIDQKRRAEAAAKAAEEAERDRRARAAMEETERRWQAIRTAASALMEKYNLHRNALEEDGFSLRVTEMRDDTIPRIEFALMFADGSPTYRSVYVSHPYYESYGISAVYRGKINTDDGSAAMDELLVVAAENTERSRQLLKEKREAKWRFW